VLAGECLLAYLLLLLLISLICLLEIVSHVLYSKYLRFSVHVLTFESETLMYILYCTIHGDVGPPTKHIQVQVQVY
jgi:hypothetical protein